jgi:hydroxypyruvate reductase
VGESLEAVRARGEDPRLLLESNDTRAFLDAAGGLIVTGLTGTNVNDLYLTLVDDGSPS